MSYVPLRDTFDFSPAVEAQVVALADRYDRQACAALHADRCGCDAGTVDPDRCVHGPVPGSASAVEVIGFLIRDGLLDASALPREETPA